MRTVAMFVLIALSYYGGAVSSEFYSRISEEIADEIRLL